MWRQVARGALQPWSMIASRRSSSSSVSSTVNSILLRSLKEHYLEKVSPPSPFTIIKGALDHSGPVLKRTYGDEEISLFVMRLANIIPGGGDDDGDDGINQLFLHVNISKPRTEGCFAFSVWVVP
ncbi:mitochondrial glycoprotein family protein [Actinidia rufa]|uniref:Mitochondrial glycoprotein family protein n=1 Tax=Actinidia rufa TaxID=165716 RepID=A0A7J0GLI5_9ERIC|nr:mitochondrial glycoprotein family protein [Actinidia rufa]